MASNVSPRAGSGRRSLLVLRLILALACLNALVLSLIALSASSGALAVARTALAGAAAVALSVVPLVGTHKIVYGQVTDESHWRRAPLFGILSALVLLADAPASETLFAALLTPVGVCVLVGDRRGGCLCAALLAAGFAGAYLQPGGPTSIEATLSDVIPVTVVIAGGLVPVKLAQGIVKAIPRELAFLALQTARGSKSVLELGSQRRAETRIRNKAIVLARLRDGRSVEEIVAETGIALKTVENQLKTLKRQEAVSEEQLVHGNKNVLIAANTSLKPRQVKYTRTTLTGKGDPHAEQGSETTPDRDDPTEWGLT